MSTSFDFSTLFGDKLSKNGSEDVSTSESLNGKNVMVYFSAHWCPPCRGFTPKLAEFYNGFKKKNSNFELVFVSSDRSEDDFKEYFNEMPWLALPFSERKLKADLSKKYKVNGIPSLIVVGPDGNTITTDGREGVSEDPEGEKFPWLPPTFEEVFPSNLKSKAGDVDSGSLKDKYLLLYFSAHWCPPCKRFTPKLAEVYNELKKNRDDFEIVFVSSDREKDSFDGYFSEMPWLALDYENREAKNGLSKIFDVSGIPSLVVLGPVKDDGKRDIINASANGSATMQNISEFPWHPKPYADITETAECNGSSINDTAAIVVLCEALDDDEQKECVEEVKKVAEAHKAAGGEEMLFFYGRTNEGLAGRVRELCKLSDKVDEPVMIKMDIPDNGGYYVSNAKEITAETIKAFMADSGERKQLE